jgi:hypothetical protein
VTSVAVLTANLGGYDVLRPLLGQTVPVDTVAYTDGPADGWRTVPPGGLHGHPRMLAKVPKCRPDLFTDAEVNIWLDASIEVVSPRFVEWLLNQLGDADLAMFAHPQRDSLLAEAWESKPMAKYSGQPVVEQATHYLTEGCDDRFGLWAGCVIVSRPSPRVRRLGDAWLREQLRWTYQDQISLPYLLASAGFRPVGLAGSIYDRRWFRFHDHMRDD